MAKSDERKQIYPKETDIKAVVSYEGPPCLLWFNSFKALGLLYVPPTST